MTPYNGHPSWNAWNIALWISNEEHLYRAAVEANGAANQVRKFRELTGKSETSRTPDGARYSNRSISHALKGLLDE